MLRFAANLTTLFNEYPFPERFAAARAAGFDEVEFLFPYEWPADDIAHWLADADLRQVLFNQSPGDWEAGERGVACHPGRKAEFRGTFETALSYAATLKTPRIHAMTGLRLNGVSEADQRAALVANLIWGTARAADAGIDLLIEPLNPHNAPGYFLGDFGLALEMIEEVATVGDQAPKLQFDIYHCARIHGDIPAWIERCAPHIAHYQIAGIPDRHEPDIGELPLAEILAAAEAYTPGLSVGCEYIPVGRTEDGLGWLAPYRSQEYRSVDFAPNQSEK